MATRLEIRTRARIRADQDSSTFPTDTQFNYLIDEACKEVWYELIRAGWPISFTQASAVTSSVSFLTLSGAFAVTGTVAFIRGVYLLRGGTYVELQRVNEGDRSGMYTSTGAEPSHYDVRIDPTDGIGVQVLPFAAGHTIVVEYIKEHPGLAADGTAWYGPGRSDELIVLKTAMKACRKEGNDQGARFLEGEYMYLMQCVQDMASWTNMRHAALIRDVGNPLGGRRLPGDYDVFGGE